MFPREFSPAIKTRTTHLHGKNIHSSSAWKKDSCGRIINLYFSSVNDEDFSKAYPLENKEMG